MAVNPVTPTTQIKTPDTTNRVPKQELGKDDFLQILSMQLSNQDPLEPMQDTDFIAQMAQFSALEQMSELNNTFNTNHAYSMIGKNVVGNVKGVGQVLGTVTGVVRRNDTDYLQVGTYSIALSDISEVYDTGHENNSLIAQSGQLIGKYVTAVIPNETTDVVTGETVTSEEKVTGKVESILMKDFTVYAKLEGTGKEIPVSYITQVTDKAPVTDAPETDEGESDDKVEGTEPTE